jgi:hypothetical protein
MCDVLLPPGVNPTAVKYISYQQNRIFANDIWLWHRMLVVTTCRVQQTQLLLWTSAAEEHAALVHLFDIYLFSLSVLGLAK